MTRIGDQSAPDLAASRIGNIAQSQAQKLTMPEQGRVTELGAWIRGLSGYGSISYVLVLWRWDGLGGSDTNPILAQTAPHSISAAAAGPGNLTKVTWPVLTPVELDAGDIFLVGISTDTASGTAHQWGVRTAGIHYRRDRTAGSGWPTSMKDAYSDAHDMAAWVESYDALGAAWVRRSGAWVRADSVQLRRSGAWVDADSVTVRRTGAWIDAD